MKTATVRRIALAVPVAAATSVGAAVMAPALSDAAQCGPGTVYDAPSDSCVVAPGAAPADWNAPAPAPPPPPPPAPALPPVSICPPIPFVAVCFPVN